MRPSTILSKYESPSWCVRWNSILSSIGVKRQVVGVIICARHDEWRKRKWFLRPDVLKRLKIKSIVTLFCRPRGDINFYLSCWIAGDSIELLLVIFSSAIVGTLRRLSI